MHMHMMEMKTPKARIEPASATLCFLSEIGHDETHPKSKHACNRIAYLSFSLIVRSFSLCVG
jgi:hypothetical protein